MIPNSLLSANAIPISRSEKLRLTFYNPKAGNSYTIAIRYQIADNNGTISDNFDTFLLGSNANGIARVLTLTDGLLIAVTVTASATGLQAGELYCTVALQYGDIANDSNLLQLVAGYLASNSPLNYPLTESRAINQTEPASLNDTFADPVPGNEISQSFDALYYTRITAFAFTFATDATIADRVPVLKIGNTYGYNLEISINALIVKNETITCYGLFGALPALIPTNVRYFQMPTMPFLRGLTIDTVTAGLQGGDQYSAIDFYSEKYVAT